MTWFKVDDNLHDHRKAALAGAEAMGLWVLCGSWCGDNLDTIGFVPRRVADRFVRGTARVAAKLVAAGLWEVAEHDGEQGWQFVHWGEFQITPDDVRKDRAAARERMRRNRAERRNGSEEVRPNKVAGANDVRPKFADVLDPTPEPVPEPIPEVPSEPANAARSSRAFDRFWEVYPRKVGRKDALRVFLREARSVDPERIIDGAIRLAADPNREPEFTPHPATWLHRGGWDDEPLAPRADRRPERAGPTRTSTTDQRVADARDAGRTLRERYERQQAAARPALSPGAEHPDPRVIGPAQGFRPATDHLSAPSGAIA